MYCELHLNLTLPLIIGIFITIPGETETVLPISIVSGWKGPSENQNI